MSDDEKDYKIAAEVSHLRSLYITHLGGSGTGDPGQVYASLGTLRHEVHDLRGQVGQLRGHMHGDIDMSRPSFSSRILTLETRIDACNDQVKQLSHAIMGTPSEVGILHKMKGIDSSAAALEKRHDSTAAALERLTHRVLVGDKGEPSIATTIDRLVQTQDGMRKWLWLIAAAATSSILKSLLDLVLR